MMNGGSFLHLVGNLVVHRPIVLANKVCEVWQCWKTLIIIKFEVSIWLFSVQLYLIWNSSRFYDIVWRFFFKNLICFSDISKYQNLVISLLYIYFTTRVYIIYCLKGYCKKTATLSHAYSAYLSTTSLLDDPLLFWMNKCNNRRQQLKLLHSEV